MVGTKGKDWSWQEEAAMREQKESSEEEGWLHRDKVLVAQQNRMEEVRLGEDKVVMLMMVMIIVMMVVVMNKEDREKMKEEEDRDFQR